MGTLKNQYGYAVGVVAFIMALSSISFAKEQYLTFEMGDGADTVSLPMTQKEILARDALQEKARVARERYRELTSKWVVTYEFGESGHVLEFPMSETEIEAAKKEIARQDSLSGKVNATQEVEVFEMGDGHSIAFPISR